MFDARLRPLIDPPLNAAGRWLAGSGVTADGMTLIGLTLGLMAAVAVALSAPVWLALGLMVMGRVADGLDGAVARATRKSDFGGYLDIFCDFIFYAAIPLAFVLRDPAANAVAGAVLIASFYVNAASFLGFAVMAEKRGLKTSAQGQKSLYYAAGLLEGAETIVFFSLIVLFPAGFAMMALVFAVLCLITAVARVILARGLLHAPD